MTRTAAIALATARLRVDRHAWSRPGALAAITTAAHSRDLMPAAARTLLGRLSRGITGTGGILSFRCPAC